MTKCLASWSRDSCGLLCSAVGMSVYVCVCARAHASVCVSASVCGGEHAMVESVVSFY